MAKLYDYKMEGLEEAQKAIDKAIKGLENAPREMVNEILKGVERHTLQFVPVDTSNLINSRYIQVIETSDGKSVGEFGFNADYAVHVHEGGPKDWQKAGASDMFLWLGAEEFIEQDLDNVLAKFGFE
jgi:hypothetical protein